MLHSHYQSCDKLTLACPNECGADARAELMEAHLTECKEQTIECAYSKIGCQERIKRKDMQKHKDDSKDAHLSLALEQVTVLTEVFMEQQLPQPATITRPSLSLTPTVTVPTTNLPKTLPSALKARPWLRNPKLFPSTPWIIKFANFNHKVAILSQPFYTGIKGYRICLQIHLSGEEEKDLSNLIVKTMLLKGPNDHLLHWPLQQDTSIILLNQLEDRNHHTIKAGTGNIDPIERIKEEEMTLFGTPARLPYQQLIQPAKANCQYMRDDSVYIKVTLVPQSLRTPLIPPQSFMLT